MQLAAYLNRIGYRGPVRPDLDCLRQVHLGQVLSIPYENIDIQLGHPVDQDVERIFHKIVVKERGGWCFELNGLLGWALREIGFDVERVTAGIRRDERGDVAFGNHLILLVRLDRLYLADHGMGDGIRQPIPVECGAHQQGTLTFYLEKTDDDYWRFRNHALAYPSNFDFVETAADEILIAAKCALLQVAPESVFVQNLICQIMDRESVTCLTGRILRHNSSEGTRKTLLQSRNDLARTLVETFGIKYVDVSRLWSKAVDRHNELFGARSIDDIEIKGM
jgi:N-hydroxyarylamine O-acetyltransferase